MRTWNQMVSNCIWMILAFSSRLQVICFGWRTNMLQEKTIIVFNFGPNMSKFTRQVMSENMTILQNIACQNTPKDGIPAWCMSKHPKRWNIKMMHVKASHKMECQNGICQNIPEDGNSASQKTESDRQKTKLAWQTFKTWSWYSTYYV